MTTWMRDWLIGQGVSNGLATFGAVGATLVVIYVLTELLRGGSKVLVGRLTDDTPEWHEKLSSRQVYRSAARTIGLVIVSDQLVPVLEGWPGIHNTVDTLFQIGIVLGLTAVFIGVVNAVVEVLETRDDEGRLPARVMGQAVIVVVVCYVAIILASLVTGENVTNLLTSITALGAVMVYVFRDLILGWTAVVQIAANDLLKVGDWISRSRDGVDGVVTEVAITTVKVKNWDGSTSAVSTYGLVTDGFTNWRSMFDGGARRMRFDLIVDATMVREVDADWPAARTEAGWPEAESPAGATNLWWFRRWLHHTVADHPLTHPEQTVLVSVRQPTPEGVPIQVHAFSSDTGWSSLEAYKSELIEQALAALPRFDLRPYQALTTQDLQTRGALDSAI
ncbi:MAG: mechanosensitive ion channel domain-containing protein [Myxococcota bacterium]